MVAIQTVVALSYRRLYCLVGCVFIGSLSNVGVARIEPTKSERPRSMNVAFCLLKGLVYIKYVS
ncbi:MAG: hypothetical protein RR273_00225 [Oscillospiraceae bacterium]